MKRKISLTASLGVIAVCSVALAQKAAPPKAAPAPIKAVSASAQSGDIRIRNSTKGKAIVNNKTGISIISVDVVVTQVGEDFILYCDSITYNERTNEAIARGNVRLQSRNSTLTGKMIRADFDTKEMTVLTNVVMNSHGKGDGVTAANDFKHKPTQITCERVDFNYENRQAVLTGDIQMKQGQNSGTCERIEFDEERNVARLEGNVLFRNGKDDQTFSARVVTIWIDTDMLEAEGIRIFKKGSGTPRKGTPSKPVRPAPTMSNEFITEFGQTLPPPPTPAPPKDEEETPPAPAVKAPETDKS